MRLRGLVGSLGVCDPPSEDKALNSCCCKENVETRGTYLNPTFSLQPGAQSPDLPN